jgi:CSLREA domain-containing protein
MGLLSSRAWMKTALVAAVLTCAFAAFGATQASAVSFVVNQTTDSGDGTCDATCTLRDAIQGANASGVPDTISFSAAGTISIATDFIPLANGTTLDATTAPGYAVGAPTVAISVDSPGSEPGLVLEANCVAKGVAVGNSGNIGIEIVGNNSSVTGSHIGFGLGGVDAPNGDGIRVSGSVTGNTTIGGPTAADRNVISNNSLAGISVDSSGPTTTIQNNYIGTSIDGLTAMGNNDGIDLYSRSQIVDNVISGNGNNAIYLAPSATTSTITGNWIGLNSAGAALGNVAYGIRSDADAVTIGGDGVGDGNVISNGSNRGIVINAGGTIIGNTIGLDATGLIPMGNAGPGIEVTGSESAVTIGGDDTHLSDANKISSNGSGIRVLGTESGITIGVNQLFANGSNELDLGNDGVDTNDALDADTGANNKQNYPVIDGVYNSGSTTIAKATLIAEPSTTYSIYFYSTDACSPSGHGGSLTFQDSRSVTTDANGYSQYLTADFDTQLPPGEQTVSAIATAPDGSSSEFSSCVTAINGDPPADPTWPPGGAAAPPADSPAPVPAPVPVAGKSLVAQPVSGKVTVLLPGSKTPVPIETLKSIPVGSIIDATNGHVILIAYGSNGDQKAEFWAGRFKVTSQTKGDQPLTDLKLLDQATGCAKVTKATIAKKKRKGSLWGNGKGKFRTSGKGGSAAVRGTYWLTQNECSGTLFQVKRGVVDVRDFKKKKTIRLKAGKRYLARYP